MQDRPLRYRPRAVLGLDVARNRVTVVKAVRARPEAACTVLAEAAAASSPEWKQRVEQELAAGAVLAAALPVHEGFLRRLTAPFPSVAKAQRVLPSLLDIQLPFPLESCICDFLSPARTADGQVSALAVAARREDVVRALDRFREAGLDPALLDHEALALWDRSLREVPLAHDAWRVVLYIGHDRTSVLLGRGSELRAASGVRLGAGDFAGDAQSAESLRHLGARINPWLRAQWPAEGARDLQWAWTGPGAADEALVARLRGVLVLPEEIQAFVHREPTTFLARAVATRALEGGSQGCNLRQDDLQHPQIREAMRRQGRRALVGAIAAALLVCALDGAWLSFLKQRRDRLQETVGALARDLAQTDRVPLGQEVLTAARALQERAPLAEPFRQAFAPSATRVLALLLRTAAAHEMAIEALAVRPHAVVCSGSASDWSQCEAIQAELAQGGWQADIERSDAGADERVHFTVKAAQ